MAEACCMEDGEIRQLADGPEQIQGANPTAAGQGTLNPDAKNPAMNPTVDLHMTDVEVIKEFIRRNSTIVLHWYVPDFNNTRVGDLIKDRLQIETTRGRILFNCPPLREYFRTSTFELDLMTGWVYTFLTPPEDIGIPYQQEEFNLNLLAQQLEIGQDPKDHQMEELKRIPLVRKIAAPADVMDLEEIEDKIQKYCELWKLYAETSVELKRKSKLSRESAVAACKVYRLYISDVLQQVDEVMKLFAMEKELRIIKTRGHFQVPQLTPRV